MTNFVSNKLKTYVVDRFEIQSEAKRLKKVAISKIVNKIFLSYLISVFEVNKLTGLNQFEIRASLQILTNFASFERECILQLS